MTLLERRRDVTELGATVCAHRVDFFRSTTDVRSEAAPVRSRIRDNQRVMQLDSRSVVPDVRRRMCEAAARADIRLLNSARDSPDGITLACVTRTQS